ncbi:MAG TPA: RNA polymerase sigma factor [Phycisphaerae bacterium]|nr:RNA polymerase sigma factor [Phycisphaerae bacterium]
MEPDSADRFLVAEIRKGSEAAWRQLIERYHGRLVAFARTRIAGLSDAEDVVQDALVGFLQSLANYDDARSLETYLFTILRYKLVDRLRSRKATALVAEGGEDDWWERIAPADAESPLDAAEAAEATQQFKIRLADLLRRLIHDYRDRSAFQDLQVIELLFYGGKRNLDVAELFEIDQKAVAGVKFRAIAKLRKFLEEAEGAGVAGFDDDAAEVTVAQVWRERRLTCLKRSTLGSYLLGVLEEPWLGYTQFHLDVVACPMCLANLRDIEEEDLAEADPQRTEHLFTSSVGFLSRTASRP